MPARPRRHDTGALGSHPPMPEKSNILFILADDMGPWAMGNAGNSDVRTPNLDRLAERGIRFDSFFCASPVCSPARATILTGRMPSAHGVHDWLAAGNSTIEPPGRRIGYLADQPAYTQHLARHGYVCGLSGKWHLGDAHTPQHGFSFWQTHAKGGSAYYNAPMIRNGEVVHEPAYVTDVITEHALTFLEQRANKSEPFSLNVHYTAPHSPWGRDHHPHDLWDDCFDNCPLTATPDQPLHPWQIHAPCGYDAKTRRQHLSGYYAAITAMDHGIGRLLDRLEQMGAVENTLVVFTSDNGMNMGHHGLWGKGNASYPANMYEESVKVPTIIAQPGTIPGGRVYPHMLSHYDFFPTLLAWTDIDAPDDLLAPGIDFSTVLRGCDDPLVERVVVFDEYGPTRMIRTDQYKYVHRTGDLPCELYDLHADPCEKHNLLGDGIKPIDAAARALMRELRDQLTDWFHEHATEECNGACLPVTGAGQTDVCWTVPPTGAFQPRSPYVDDSVSVPRRQKDLK